MFYTFTEVGQDIVDSQLQKHFQVELFEDEAKTVKIGNQMFIAGEAYLDDPEAEFVKNFYNTTETNLQKTKEAQEAQEAARQSGISKLAALGLTQDEINALTGAKVGV